MGRLKRLECKEGKLCLEGKVVDYEIVRLRTVSLKQRSYSTNESEFNEAIIDKIRHKFASRANAYFLGDGGSKDSEVDFHWVSPILYVKIGK